MLGIHVDSFEHHNVQGEPIVGTYCAVDGFIYKIESIEHGWATLERANLSVLRTMYPIS